MGILGKLLLSIGSGLATLAIVAIAWLLLVFPDRTDVFETLDAPRNATGWTIEGIVLETGEIVPLPGIDVLPARSEILDEIVHHGIEVDPEDHRVYGLLPIHHWCGNDPIGKHVARVDVASVLEFARMDNDSGEAGSVITKPSCASVGKWGWNVSCYSTYEKWLAEAGYPK